MSNDDAVIMVSAVLKRRDGTTEEPQERLRMSGSYESFGESQALEELLNNGAAYGFRVDSTLDMIILGGIMIPQADFAGLQVSIFSRERIT